MHRSMASLVLFLMSAGAAAATPVDCEAGATNMAQVRDCGAQQSEDAVQRAYDELYAKLERSDPDTARLLAQAQDDWEAFAAGTCEVHTRMRTTGKLANDLRAQCRAEVDAARVRWLQDARPIVPANVASAPSDCERAISTPEVNACVAEDLARADDALDAVYRHTLARLLELGDEWPDAVEARQTLVEAQRRWVEYRDRDCEAIYTLNRGGTSRTVLQLGCLIARTEQRTKELQQFFD